MWQWGFLGTPLLFFLLGVAFIPVMLEVHKISPADDFMPAMAMLIILIISMLLLVEKKGIETRREIASLEKWLRPKT